MSFNHGSSGKYQRDQLSSKDSARDRNLSQENQYRANSMNDSHSGRYNIIQQNPNYQNKDAALRTTVKSNNSGGSNKNWTNQNSSGTDYA